MVVKKSKRYNIEMDPLVRFRAFSGGFGKIPNVLAKIPTFLS